MGYIDLEDFFDGPSTQRTNRNNGLFGNTIDVGLRLASSWMPGFLCTEHGLLTLLTLAARSLMLCWRKYFPLVLAILRCLLLRLVRNLTYVQYNFDGIPVD